MCIIIMKICRHETLPRTVVLRVAIKQCYEHYSVYHLLLCLKNAFLDLKCGLFVSLFFPEIATEEF
jgi:hypothetical protein